MVLRAFVALLAFLVLAPAAAAQPAPQNLRAFVLRANEPEDPTRTFSRTPAFAWNPVNGATSYEFQLSTSRTFSENAIVWEKADIAAPLTNVPLTLPWMTGAPFSFYARVRTNVKDDAGPWSERYGFRMRAPAPPATLTPNGGVNPRPGMVRWTPVDGATAYEVTFSFSQGMGVSKRAKTATTAADLREHYTLHNWWPGTAPISWRVRAVREVEGRALNNLPSVSYGAWSVPYTTIEPPLVNAPITPTAAISRSRANDIENSASSGVPEPHELVPGFHWTGVQNLGGQGAVCPPDVESFNVTCPLFHVYVYTDEDCVNRVHVSDLVGSPAYVPRLTPPLEYPGDTSALAKVVTGTSVLMLGDGAEGENFDAGAQRLYAAGTDPDLPPIPGERNPREEPDRRSGIWDNDWPDGRYYWTVVPAVPTIEPDLTVEYHDIEFGEEMCRAGRLLTFGKTSAPAIERENGVPFLSGMVTTGQIRAATTNQPRFFGRVLAAWKPAPGATQYELQWSKKLSPFRPAGSVKTPNTAYLLGLDPGVWYYRVRGIDESIPSLRQGMTWSDPQYVRISPRTFSVVRGG
ncbi:MAG TPA: hypothetical protein VHF67_01420 [Gaiellaceae bacterium]|nr:hypothetical protein [Gaiellaceae bacterium]